MATPIGHALAGYVVYSTGAAAQAKEQRAPLLWCLLLAVAPDFDFVPGLLRNEPNLYHQGVSHSLGCAFLVSFMAMALFLLWNKARRNWLWFPVFFFAYSSHLLIDMFAPDGRPPYGIPLFWPLSMTYYLAPTPIFRGVHHAKTLSASAWDWFMAILNWDNVVAIGTEFLILAPFVVLSRVLKKSSLPL